MLFIVHLAVTIAVVDNEVVQFHPPDVKFFLLENILWKCQWAYMTCTIDLYCGSDGTYRVILKIAKAGSDIDICCWKASEGDNNLSAIGLGKSPVL